jgi:hypothetical protein
MVLYLRALPVKKKAPGLSSPAPFIFLRKTKCSTPKAFQRVWDVAQQAAKWQLLAIRALLANLKNGPAMPCLRVYKTAS